MSDPVLNETVLIPSDTPGIRLCLHHRWRSGAAPFGADRTLVMVHGATFSSRSLFDVPIDGVSLLDQLAGAGIDVFALDVRGYGGSDRPPEMERSGEVGDPLCGTAIGMRDLASAMRFVRERAGLDRVAVLGMSWGGTAAGAFAAAEPEHVSRLVLVAPQWLRDGPSPLDPGGPIGAWRPVDVAGFEVRWLRAAPPEHRDALLPKGWFRQWAAITLGSDPHSPVPGAIRAVNGPIADQRAYWSRGRPFYDPASIRAPVLLVHGEWDQDVTEASTTAFFAALTGTDRKRRVEIGRATHMVLLERERQQAFEAIASFLGGTPISAART